jgi:hypothetical protein
VFKFMRLILLLTLSLILTACGGTTDSPVPTLVEIPDATATTPPAVAVVSTTSAPLSTEVPALTPTAATQISDSTATLTTPMVTPSLTITQTVTPLPTVTASNTAPPDPLDGLVALALQATILPPGYGGGGTPGSVATLFIPPTPDLAATQAFTCAFAPPGGFGFLFSNDPTLRPLLGCPVGSPPTNVVLAGALQTFEFGAMVWVAGNPAYIYVFYPNGTYHRYMDSFVDGVDPVSGNETPPSSNLLEPVRGFGKVWRIYPDVRPSLGWATIPEAAGTVTMLDFDFGAMLHIDRRGDVIVLKRSSVETGTWRAAPGMP